MTKIKLQCGIMAATLVSLAAPVSAQPFTWSNASAATYRPTACLVSIRESREPEWTRGDCHEVAFTESTGSINLHFRTDGVGRNHVIVTFVIPAESRGRQTMPVVAVGLNTNGNRFAKETVGGFDQTVNACQIKGSTIACNAVIKEGNKAWGFVTSASLD